MARVRERVRRHRAKNRDKINKRHRDRMKSDPEYCLRINLRNRLQQAQKKNYKKGMAVNLLGISIKEFKAYIESQFQPGMSWSNHGEWHLDHIISLSSGNLFDSKFLEIVCNYKNIRPLWAFDNLSKGGKCE